MSERYSRVFTLQNNLYAEGSPVIIEAGALLLDNITGNILAQLKFLNVESKKLRALKIKIVAFDSAGRILDGEISHQYLDLDCSYGETFGAKDPAFLPNFATRSIGITIEEAIFEDGSVWQGKIQKLSAIPEKELLQTLLPEEEEQEYYKRIFYVEAKYRYAEHKDLIFCTCGNILKKENDECPFCGCSFEALKNTTRQTIRNEITYRNAMVHFEKGQNDIYYTLEKIEEYETALELFSSITDWEDSAKKAEVCKKRLEELAVLDAKEKAERAERTARNKKIAIITLSVVAALTLIILLVVKVILPTFRYNDAVEKMENEEYLAAAAIYDELENFKDSEEKALYNRYLYAKLCEEKGEYESAKETYVSLGVYKDSKEKAVDAHYNLACSQVNNQEYDAAIQNFKELENYKDSADLYNTTCYSYGKILMEKGDFEKAAEIFVKVQTYQDSYDLKNQCHVEKARQHYNAKEYSLAITWYNGIWPKKENPDNFYFESCYLYAMELKSKGDNALALTYFQDANGYGDSNKQIKEVKYSYVLANKNGRDTTTFKYLKELKEENYLDSAAIYKDLYTWKATISSANTSRSDYNTKVNSINKKVYYFHYSFDLSGGEPGEKGTFYHKTRWPDGQVTVSDWNWENESSGSSLGGEWSDGFSITSGTITFEIYHKETGKLIGSHSIRVS